MGQYGNQPDFGTIVSKLVDIAKPFPPSAIYVGETELNDGTASFRAKVVGNATDEPILITGISSGTILPFIVTEISNLEGVNDDNIFLYR
jgi:hypothetical protein